MNLAIQKYAKGADTRDLNLLDKAFHEHFQVVALMPESVMRLDKKAYMKLIQDKKIGGVSRTLKILTSDNDGKIGTAKITLTGGKMVFHDYLTLINTPDKGWQIVSNAAYMAPRN